MCFVGTVAHGWVSCVLYPNKNVTYLTVRFGRRSLSASDFVLHVKIVDVGVSLWWGVVRLQLLSEVELHSTILHQDMREQGTACQRFLGCPESHA